MKIALCFSGQPRFINECANSIIQNVIHANNAQVDVFAHLWFGEKLLSEPYKFGGNGQWKDQRIDSGAIYDFKRIYNVHENNIKVERPIKFSSNFMEEDFEVSQKRYWPHSLDEKLEPNFKEWRIDATLSNFYSMSKVNELKSLHEHKNNFQYDWVIKCRTDVNVLQPLVLNQYDSEVFNCTSLMQQPPHVNDWLCWGNSEVMSCFMGVFPIFKRIFNLTKYYNDNCWDNETLHVTLLNAMQIEVSRHPIHLSVPRF